MALDGLRKKSQWKTLIEGLRPREDKELSSWRRLTGTATMTFVLDESFYP